MEVAVSAPPPLAIDTNGCANGKRKSDFDSAAPAQRLGCAHAPDGADWLRARIHETLRRARHGADAKRVPWDADDGAPCFRSERALCLSCDFSGRRDDARDETQCFLTHAMRSNHHFALLPRHKQLFCARCLDFVYPEALLAITQHATPSSHRPHHNGHQHRAQELTRPHQHRHHQHQQHQRAPSLRRRLMRSAARRGLVNMGNTCFMNAVLQALAHNPLVQHEYFVVRGHNTTICEQRRRHKAQHELADVQTTSPVEPCMGCEMASLLQTLFPAPRATLTARHLTSPVVPQSFMETFWASSPSFIGSQQQDAHEFLVALLNGVHKDTCPRSSVAAPATPGDVSQKPTSPRFTPTGQSLCDCVVHQNFAGVFSSEIACVFCDTVSSKYDPFLDITLSLETPNATPRKTSTSRPKEEPEAPAAPESMSLVSLLERFTYEERLKGSNQVYCRRCSRYVDAMKRLVIHKLPNLLVLHLGRFDFAKKRKIMDAVSFPLRGLDLRAFCSDVDSPLQDPVTPNLTHHSRSRKDVVACENVSGRSSPMTPPPMTPPPTAHSRDAVYDLAAVISHHGDSVDGGHFTAFVHSSQEHAASATDLAASSEEANADASPWLHFDDSKVERVTATRVEETQAYMLLYVRRRLFV